MNFGSAMYKAILPLLVFGIGLATGAHAQSPGLTLTNQDIVTLAKAGFNEDFLIDLIGTSHTHFDLSGNALAELAKQGLTERLMRAMLATAAAAGLAITPSGLAVTPSGPGAAPSGPGKPEGKGRSRTPKVKEPAESTLAIANHVPYYRSSSMMWGLMTKKLEIGAPAAGPTVGSSLGAAYGQYTR
jgi:hypothetical protein